MAFACSTWPRKVIIFKGLRVNNLAKSFRIWSGQLGNCWKGNARHRRRLTEWSKHDLRVTSHVLHQDVPFGWYQVRFFWIILGHSWGPGEGQGGPWYGTFAKPTSHFTEGMFEKCWFFLDSETPKNVYQNCWCTKIAGFENPQNLPFWELSVLVPFRVPKNHLNVYRNCWCTKIVSFEGPQNLRFWIPSVLITLCVLLIDAPSWDHWPGAAAMLSENQVLQQERSCNHIRSDSLTPREGFKNRWKHFPDRKI